MKDPKLIPAGASESNLPQGWARTSVGEVIDAKYGKGLKEENRRAGNISVYGSNGVVGTHSVALTTGPTIILGRKGSIGAVHWLVMASPRIFNEAWSHVTGSAQPTLPLGNLRTLPVRVPPLAEQKQIVRRVNALFNLADAIERSVATATAKAGKLAQTVLAKALRGELVPQDPNDEPAAVLLERIRAARANTTDASAPSRRKRLGNSSTSSEEVIMLKRNEITPSHLTAILKERGPLTAEALWSASQLDIDDFYSQLKDEEANGFLKETRNEPSGSPRLLQAAA